MAETPARAVDSRTLRTVAAIEAAVRAALREIPLDDLTIAEVCRLADIKRPSFYTHFDSIPELVAHMLTAEINNVLPIPGVEEVAAEQIEPLILDNFAVALELIARDRELYRAAFTSSSSGVLRDVLDRAIGMRVRNIITIWQDRGLVGDVDVAVAIPFVTGGIIRAIEAWAFDDATDATDRARAIRDLMPGWWPTAS